MSVPKRQIPPTSYPNMSLNDKKLIQEVGVAIERERIEDLGTGFEEGFHRFIGNLTIYHIQPFK